VTPQRFSAAAIIEAEFNDFFPSQFESLQKYRNQKINTLTEHELLLDSIFFQGILLLPKTAKAFIG
jgi:hypothetical protein